MAFCNQCGTQLEDGAVFCTACGAQQNSGQTSAGGQGTPQSENKAADAWNKFTDTPDTTGEYDPKDIEDNKVMAILAYLGILFLVPLLAAPNSRFARFHANQGLVLFIASIAVGIVGTIFAYIPVLGGIISFVLWVAVVVFVIIGIVNASKGQAKELPLIGNLKILK